MAAETLRVATWSAPLSRDGPGLLLRDIIGGKDVQIDAMLAVVLQVRPDILLLTDFDYDLNGAALAAFADALTQRGLVYPTRFALEPNSGMSTGLDMDGNGRTGEARDAQGFGEFSGDGGMAILSRLPIDTTRVTDLSALIWMDLNLSPFDAFPSTEVAAAQRLSTTGHWIVPVDVAGGVVTLLAFSATPPLFDGPEGRNRWRNRDELALWGTVMAGRFGPAPQRAILIGNANLDPADGAGFTEDMAQLLAGGLWQDPRPASQGALLAADPGQRGDPALDTADWPDDGPGNLRVSYVLPSPDLAIRDSGVFWPVPDSPDAVLLGPDGLAAGPHHLVWVDLALD